jgi:mannose/fructose/N-acetylgalactosamine-specific phosphotransferase system component IID
MKMPDRAVVSIGPALSLAFILGLIAAMELLNRAARLDLGVIGFIAVAITGPLSVIGLRAGVLDRLVVGVLRGLLAAFAFALIYLGMIKFASLGEIALGIALFIAGGLAILALAQLRVRPDSGDSPLSPV